MSRLNYLQDLGLIYKKTPYGYWHFGDGYDEKKCKTLEEAMDLAEFHLMENRQVNYADDYDDRPDQYLGEWPC